ncbi:unnamed protein product [Cuscuta epithymum]|uniref:Uncharacterized protein n=1 Tax=Cuscuta epithymum TaxID=186058 RepID=A0AAV0BZQ5_9ASTE|nr:unnamed protein product [Cuscuta epithymum]
MPKDHRVNSLSNNRVRASPYHPCSLRETGVKSEKSSPIVGDEREWEEARCPICMEHPHNAVLLLCSSLENGCRPYMCDTSYRHSNCLDQFCKSFAARQPILPPTSATSSHRGRMERLMHAHIRSLGNQQLVCPLCRGQIKGCVVVEAARGLMNSKTRSCSRETCDFTGTYVELRKHAREEHPSHHPSETDPRRESEWTRLQLQRDFEDTLNAYQSHLTDFDEDYIVSLDEEFSISGLEHEFPFSFHFDESPFDLSDFNAWFADDELLFYEDDDILLPETLSNYFMEDPNSIESVDRHPMESRSRSSTLHSNNQLHETRSRRSTETSSHHYREHSVSRTPNSRHRSSSTRRSNDRIDGGSASRRRAGNSARRASSRSRSQQWNYESDNDSDFSWYLCDEVIII